MLSFKCHHFLFWFILLNYKRAHKCKKQTCGLLAVAVWWSSLNISSTVFCLSTLVFFLGTRLYVPILLFFLRDDNPPELEPAAQEKKGYLKETPKH